MATDHHIHARDVQVGDERVVFPKNGERIASYNWSSASRSGQPRMIVPGSPLNYIPSARRVFELSRDGGDFWFDDANAVNMGPSFSPMEPIFHSLSICAPDVDVRAFDVIADTVVMMRLLRFCRSPGDRDIKYHGLNNQPFKFFIHTKGPDREGKPPTMVFSPARAEEEGERYSAGFGGRFHDTFTEKDPSIPSDASRFYLIRKFDLDGMALLVRSGVGARDTGVARTPSPSSRRRANNMGAVKNHVRGLLLEAAGQAQRGTHIQSQGEAPRVSLAEKAPLPPPSSGSSVLPDVGLPSTNPGRKSSASDGFQTGSGLESMISGELLSEDARIVELKVSNRRFSHKVNWKDFLWHQLLGGTQALLLGVYEVTHNRAAALFRRPEHVALDEIKARANETGSSSLVYLANTLREVAKIAQRLIAIDPSKTGRGDEGPPGVVVEYTPDGEKVLRLRLAVPEDGAIAP